MDIDDEKIISPELLQNEGQEERYENSLRPKVLDEYIGQDKVKENMKVYIEAAKKRGEPLDHCLFYGPPGLGKTTLSTIIYVYSTGEARVLADCHRNMPAGPYYPANARHIARSVTNLIPWSS